MKYILRTHGFESGNDNGHRYGVTLEFEVMLKISNLVIVTMECRCYWDHKGKQIFICS